MTIRAAVIRELRSSPLPISTSDLAAICAPNRPHPAQQVNALMRELERMKVVRRHALVAGYG